MRNTWQDLFEWNYLALPDYYSFAEKSAITSCNNRVINVSTCCFLNIIVYYKKFVGVPLFAGNWVARILLSTVKKLVLEIIAINKNRFYETFNPKIFQQYNSQKSRQIAQTSWFFSLFPIACIWTVQVLQKINMKIIKNNILLLLFYVIKAENMCTVFSIKNEIYLK